MCTYCRVAIFSLIATLVTTSIAHASRGCLKNPTPYLLMDDLIEWSLSLDPGADCIQSLQVSKSRVYSIAVAEPPAAGELILTGPAFRYFANSDASVADKFTLIIYGRNRQGEGFS